MDIAADPALTGVIAKFEHEKGRITIVVADDMGVGVCADTEEHAAELRKDFAVKQLARQLGGGRSITFDETEY